MIATFAAGCFWGVEAALRSVDGVLETSAGYTGGQTVNPSYEQVCSHTTGHAEAVEVRFDPELVSYEQLLDTFWTIHNPTLLTTAGWSLGDQYRSAIFVHDGEQAALAAASRDRAQARFDKSIVTEIAPAGPFYRAEDRHQQYFERHGRAHAPGRARTVH